MVDNPGLVELKELKELKELNGLEEIKELNGLEELNGLTGLTGLKLVIDHRESSSLKEYIDVMFDPSDIEWRLLPLGDIIIEHNEKALLVIERKTIQDLAASVKDGRYKNQKSKLIASLPKDIICYLIEGDLSFTEQTASLHGISINAIHSCIINTILRDKLLLFQTKNVKETCSLLKQIFTRYNKDPQKYQQTNNADNDIISPVVVKRCGKTKKECYIAQLCQIPGVLKKTASAICDVYQDMPALLTALHEQGEQALDNVKTESNGKKRALSKTVSKTVLEYMANA